MSTDQSPWISVKERLPTDQERKEALMFLTIYPNGVVFDLPPSERIDGSVTHWMFIPRLPKLDPFREWHAQYGSLKFGWVNESALREIWDAALAHVKEGK